MSKQSVEERVILVDEQDQPIGSEEKQAAHEKALRHRAFSVFIFRPGTNQLEVLLQQRNFEKYHCGGLWTNTCCSHPRLGEETKDAAQRRLQEEMGFTLPLTKAGVFEYRAEFNNGLTEHEIDHVFVAWMDSQIIQPNPDEVAEVRWQDVNDLEAQLSKTPQTFTPWLAKALKIAKFGIKIHNPGCLI